MHPVLPTHTVAASADALEGPRPQTKRRGPPAHLTLVHKPLVTSAIVDNGPAVPAQTVAMVGHPDGLATRPRSLRNVKRLSLSISSAGSSQHASPSSPTAPASLAAGGAPPPPRRPSIASLPGASAATLLYKDESETNGAPYLDGPIEIMPGIWLGAEDNARDWPGLVSRRIKAILNVAKEVAGPVDAALTGAPDASLRNFVSTPDLQKPPTRPTGTYWHAHAPSGRPAMHYLKLAWSHGQSDLVNVGFVEGMHFVDDALARNEGVLIQYVVIPSNAPCHHSKKKISPQLSVWCFTLRDDGDRPGNACSRTRGPQHTSRCLGSPRTRHAGRLHICQE